MIQPYIRENVRNCKNMHFVWIAVCVLVIILLCFMTFRVSKRYHALYQLSRIPDAKQRILVIPTHKVFTETGQLESSIDLGYATFTFPLKMKLYGNTHGVRQTCISLTNETISIVFLPPFKNNSVDGIHSEVKVEKSKWPSVWQVMLLSNKQFLSLITYLSFKASTSRGWYETYSYDARNSVGLVRIGDSPNDRLHASVSLSDKKGNNHVGFHIKLDSISTVSIDEILKFMLSSFCFKLNSGDTCDSVYLSDVIHKAGIQRGSIDIPCGMLRSQKASGAGNPGVTH